MDRLATGFLHMAISIPALRSIRSCSRRWAAGFTTGQGLDGLTDFLGRAGVSLPEIERAWQNLMKRRIYSVPRVSLTRAQIEALRP